MKNLLLVLGLAVALLCTFALIPKRQTEKSSAKHKSKKLPSAEERLLEPLQKTRELLAENPEFNTEFAFFIDMKIPSGRNRFFVYDLNQNKIVDKGLVAHGSGSETGIEGELKFSNVPNSLSTSLGKYSVGRSYSGQFGKAYKLHGLDDTNDNAYVRNVVLHRYEKVPYDEQANPICNSAGCPMVSDTYFARIDSILAEAKKPIILYIYY